MAFEHINIPFYQSKLEQEQSRLSQLKSNRFNTGMLRLAVFVLGGFCIYLLINNYHFIWWPLLILSAFIFFFLLRKSNKINMLISETKKLIEINEYELVFLNGDQSNFDNGSQFSKEKHAFAFDLDIFGENGLYQHLNRTATFAGSLHLKNALLNFKQEDEILKIQESIQELKDKTDWRQKINALALVNKDSESLYKFLNTWADEKEAPINTGVRILSYLMPVVFFTTFVLSFISANPIWPIVAFQIFLINVGIAFSQYKRIKKHLQHSDKVNTQLYQYGEILLEIENEKFNSSYLNSIQQRLVTDNTISSSSIKKLSRIFSNLESVQNLVVALIFNGFFLFHVHVLNQLIGWKEKYADQINLWINSIGKIEHLNSLANLYFNNPEFSFPEFNKEKQFSFQEIGHPLINKQIRISNSIDLTQHPFFILTGSNMSGKSTFLRSLGVNLVLAYCGSVVCAKKADIDILPLFVSMRMSDSLADQESYFYAEVKRLKYIISNLESEQCFILLDEILRGTNSDDKRNGTIEVIKRMIKHNVIGGIATHDLEVCNTTNEYPDYLNNLCFEGQIKNNDLYFDYILKEGICKTKNATFLMKKVGIID